MFAGVIMASGSCCAGYSDTESSPRRGHPPARCNYIMAHARVAGQKNTEKSM